MKAPDFLVIVSSPLGVLLDCCSCRDSKILLKCICYSDIYISSSDWLHSWQRRETDLAGIFSAPPLIDSKRNCVTLHSIGCVIFKALSRIHKWKSGQCSAHVWIDLMLSFYGSKQLKAEDILMFRHPSSNQRSPRGFLFSGHSLHALSK